MHMNVRVCLVSIILLTHLMIHFSRYLKPSWSFDYYLAVIFHFIVTVSQISLNIIISQMHTFDTLPVRAHLCCYHSRLLWHLQNISQDILYITLSSQNLSSLEP